MKKLMIAACGLAWLAGFVWPSAAMPKQTWKPARAQVKAAKKIGKPVVLKNSIGMKFVLIPAGNFVMGSPPGEPKRDADEGPRHRVVISRPFYLQTTEVTQAQYRAIMGKNPSEFKGCNPCPVEGVNYLEALEFIRRLNAREKTNKYRLPTEAEWEYAARAGGATAYGSGDDPNRLDEFGWYNKNSGHKTHPVAQKRPNAWGLYDLAGNVCEWCSDWYGRNYYTSSPVRDPRGPASGRHRVLRGGCYLDTSFNLRSASRGRNYPSSWYSYYGFRLVRDY